MGSRVRGNDRHEAALAQLATRPPFNLQRLTHRRRKKGFEPSVPPMRDRTSGSGGESTPKNNSGRIRLPIHWCEGPFFPTNPGALSEEDQMNSLYDPAINAMVMPHFKAEAKRLLIEKGHVSTSTVPTK